MLLVMAARRACLRAKTPSPANRRRLATCGALPREELHGHPHAQMHMQGNGHAVMRIQV
jgi:hypothetical protein